MHAFTISVSFPELTKGKRSCTQIPVYMQKIIKTKKLDASWEDWYWVFGLINKIFLEFSAWRWDMKMCVACDKSSSYVMQAKISRIQWFFIQLLTQSKWSLADLVNQQKSSRKTFAFYRLKSDSHFPNSFIFFN